MLLADKQHLERDLKRSLLQIAEKARARARPPPAPALTAFRAAATGAQLF